MALRNFGVLVVGSAARDQVIYAGALTRHFKDGALGGKVDLVPSVAHPDGTINRAGGSALNTSLTLGPIAHALGIGASIYTCMRLGCNEHNLGKDLILKMLGNPRFGDPAIIDPMYDSDYRVPKSVILENGPSKNRQRLVVRGLKTDFPPYPGFRSDISRKLEWCGFVIGNSNPAPDTAIAFEEAQQYGARRILDYSENVPENLERAAALIRMADYVVAPDDALLPGMTEPDPQELRRRFVEDYGRRHVAVSNSNNEVLVHDNGEDFTIPVRTVIAQNVCGAGDTRDAALCAALAHGLTFQEAIAAATDIATFYVQQPNRETFAQNLPAYVASNSLYHWAHGETQVPAPAAAAA